jgi:hypothetical protein
MEMASLAWRTLVGSLIPLTIRGWKLIFPEELKGEYQKNVGISIESV